jgi:ubiquinone biosynthesis monooxygenase Coq7
MNKPNPNAETLEQMLRVDHAGEYGANRIYEGQLMVLKNSRLRGEIEHMLQQEQEHLKKFDELLVANKVRPSVFMPFWHVAGVGLGVISGLLGEKAAMAATVAVESVIDGHYAEQLKTIDDPELKATISKFRDEEIEHKNKGLEYGAQDMKGYELFTNMIKIGAKASIWLAKRF